MKRLALYAFLFALGFPTAAQAEPTSTKTKPDPVLGNWVWPGEHLTTVHADGTAVMKEGNKATWTFLKNNEVERKYKFIWDGGLYVHSLILSKDMKMLEGKDNVGHKLVIRRAADEQPK